MIRALVLIVASLLTLGAARPATAPALPAGFVGTRLVVPDVVLTDQTGRQQRLYTDLVRGRTVAIAFVFTGCSSICPVIGRRLAEMQATLPGRMGRDMGVVAISVDPRNDTPAALSRFGASVGARPGWTFLTGNPDVIATTLAKLGQGGGLRENHTGYVLIANDRAGIWTRIDATAATAKMLSQRMVQAAAGGSTRGAQTAAYFRSGMLRTHDGRSVSFYRDVLRDRVVVVDTLFTRCTDACPLVTQKLLRTRRLLGPAANNVEFVSISSDPRYDTPAELAAFARKSGIGPGWTLLTGAPDKIEWLLWKLNLGGAAPTDHSTALLVGNDRSGSWRKVSPAAPPEEIARVVRTALAEPPRP